MKHQTSNIKHQILIIVGLTFGFFNHAEAATLFAGSASDTIEMGQTFIVEWFLDTEEATVNLFSLKLQFSAQTLELLEAVPADSAFNLALRKPEIDNGSGSMTFTAGVGGGASGKNLPVLRTVFLAKQSGAATIAMQDSTELLANDGAGTPLPVKFQELNFVISPSDFLPVTISSSTHPEQEHWYRENRVYVSFTSRADEEYSYSFSSNMEIIPDNVPEVNHEMFYDNLPDGVYYFKLHSRPASQDDSGPWIAAGLFRVQIDTTAPEDFYPVISSSPDAFEENDFISFVTVDKTSGISHYKIDAGLVRGIIVSAAGPYKLPRFLIGDTITVTASDNAGNTRSASINYRGALSQTQFVGLVVAIVVVLSAAVLWFGRKTIFKDSLAK